MAPSPEDVDRSNTDPGYSLGNEREVKVEVGERHVINKHMSKGHAGSQSEAGRGGGQREDWPVSTEELTP